MEDVAEQGKRAAERPHVEIKPEARRTEATKPKPAAPAGIDDPAVCRCGKVTAQPRYVVFDLVWGRLKKVQKRTIAGIFCRTCADRAAVKASLLTWVAGWWAWPSGPKETIRALINNVRGGRKPAVRNARLLLRQARAFLARGEMDLARSAGEQALQYAKATNLRGEVEQFLMPLAGATRTIKDRWAKPGWAPMVQVLPLAVIVAGLSTFAAYSTRVPLTELAIRYYGRLTAPATPPVAPSASVIGRVYSVVGNSTAVRTGPGMSYQLEAVLKAGTLVLATETAPDGGWLRIVTSDGTAGFVATKELTAEVPADAIDDVGAFAPAKSN